MDFETFNAMGDNVYRAALMVIQGTTLVAGLASVAFTLLAIVSATCDGVANTVRSPRRQIEPVSAAHARNLTWERGRLARTPFAPH